jgi:hypothetical protein
MRYARWRNEGEVDIVYLAGAHQKPFWIGEVKWSDRVGRDFAGETRHIRHMIQRNRTITSAFVTSRTISGMSEIEGVPVQIDPTALRCYTVGRNLTAGTAAGEFQPEGDEPELAF